MVRKIMTTNLNAQVAEKVMKLSPDSNGFYLKYEEVKRLTDPTHASYNKRLNQAEEEYGKLWAENARLRKLIEARTKAIEDAPHAPSCLSLTISGCYWN